MRTRKKPAQRRSRRICLLERNGTLAGGEGDDRLYGNPGADEIYGGSGNDDVGAHDNSPNDVVDCGEGVDSYTADPGDEVTGCETQYTPE